MGVDQVAVHAQLVGGRAELVAVAREADPAAVVERDADGGGEAAGEHRQAIVVS